MNVYDTANKLAEEIKQSEEFITYQMAKQAINLNFELKSKIEEFEKARYDAQIIAIQTGKDDENKMRHVLFQSWMATGFIEKHPGVSGN